MFSEKHSIITISNMHFINMISHARYLSIKSFYSTHFRLSSLFTRYYVLHHPQSSVKSYIYRSQNTINHTHTHTHTGGLQVLQVTQKAFLIINSIFITNVCCFKKVVRCLDVLSFTTREYWQVEDEVLKMKQKTWIIWLYLDSAPGFPNIVTFQFSVQVLCFTDFQRVVW